MISGDELYFASMSLKELIIGYNIHAHIHTQCKERVVSKCSNNVLLLELDSLGQRKLFTVVDGATERGEKYTTSKKNGYLLPTRYFPSSVGNR